MGEREVAQWLRALAGLVEDHSFVPSTHALRFTTTCDSSAGEADIPFWPLWTLPLVTDTYAHK